MLTGAIYHWGTSLVVMEQIHDIGQYIIQYSFYAGSNSSSIYFHIFFLITFLNRAFIRNIIIIQCINYVIIICLNENNALINNNYGRSQDLIFSSKFLWAYERISSQSVDSSSTCPQKGLPAVRYTILIQMYSSL